ncbi:MAG: hypothetical protein PHE93_00820 [Clostridia bacterium]|nr:hypothetical protein [Clostridia bacterium]
MEEKVLDVQTLSAIREDNKSTVEIGKFKNAEELLKAYNALEAEFTRRSQRLADMEKRSNQAADKKSHSEEGEKTFDNSSGEIDGKKTEQPNTNQDAISAFDAQATYENKSDFEEILNTQEKKFELSEITFDENAESEENNADISSSKNESSSEYESICENESCCEDDTDIETQNPINTDESEWKEKVDKFFLLNPKAQPFAKQIAREMISDDSLKNDKNGLEIAFSRFLVKSYKSPNELAQNDEFLSKYVFSNEEIKSRVIEDYLTGLSQKKTPATIKSSGVTTLTPPSRPKSLQEAGWMFVRDNK